MRSCAILQGTVTLDYMITACVRFSGKRKMKDRATGRVTECSGYFAKFGVSATTVTKAREILSSFVRDGSIVWEDTSVEDAVWDSLDQEIRLSSKGFGSVGIWYQGPHFLFP